MSKIIVLEGLPGTGKTTLVEHFSECSEVETIAEIISNEKEWLATKKVEDQDFFWANDIEKFRRAHRSNKIVLMDRGYVSTLAYNFAKKQLEKDAHYDYLLGRYYIDFVEKSLQPTHYVYIDVSLQDSFARKERSFIKGNPWYDPNYLNHIINYYQYFFEELEPNVHVTRVSPKNTLEDIKKDITEIVA